MPRYIDADALENEVHTFCREFIVSCRDFRTKCALYDAMKGVLVRIYDAPTLSPDDVRGGGCAYCKEDRDGYTMPLEKNAHAWVQYPNKLVIQFGKEIRKCEIKYCPMCGARMKGAKDGTTDNS